MKIPLKLLGIVFAALAACHTAGAQQAPVYPEHKQYRDAVGRVSALFRGRQATKYQFRYNGHYYWDNPTFKNGDILFEGRFYPDVPMNIDAVRQEILVLDPENVVPIAINPADVSSFNLAEKNFVCIDGAIREILYKGPNAALYRKVAKTLETSPDNVNGREIGYSDPSYDYKVITYFSYKQTLYVSKAGGELVIIKSKGAFRRQFKEYRKEIKTFLSGNYAVVDSPLAEYCTSILEHLGI